MRFTSSIPGASAGRQFLDRVSGHLTLLRVGSAAPRPSAVACAWTGAVLKVDHFGNLITNFRPVEFPQVNAGRFEMAVGTERVSRLALIDPLGLWPVTTTVEFLDVTPPLITATATISTGPGGMGAPQIDGKQMVWQSFNGQDYDEIYYNIQTGQKITHALKLIRPSTEPPRMMTVMAANTNWKNTSAAWRHQSPGLMQTSPWPKVQRYLQSRGGGSEC